MSKTTKIIAALGVVAGLGVAALPAFTFATDTSVTGDVEVQVEVQPAIAMTIEGNNDDGTHATDYFEAKTPETDNPKTEGLYELDNSNHYVLTNDETVNPEKTYYEKETHDDNYYNEVSTFAPDTIPEGAHIGNYVVPASITAGTSSSYTAMLPASIVNGAWNASAATPAERGFASKITVYTNSVTGYTLTVADKDADTSLAKADGTASIPAGTAASPATTFDLEAGTAAWGYKVNPESTTRTGYTPISTTEADVDSSSTATTGGKATIVTYGVATANDQATGVYSDVIVYTATVQ